MKTDDSQLSALKFIAIAVVLMIFVDQFIFGGTRSYIEDVRNEYHAEQMIEQEVKDLPPVRVLPEEGDFFEQLPPPETPKEEPKPEAKAPPVIVPEAQVVAPSYTGKARIAVIIDDLGMDIKRSRKIVEMKAPLTLAFLPYGTKTRDLAAEGKKNGHSLIIHTPMEASDPHQNIGPMGLRTEMDRETFDRNFVDMLASFDGYEGINNHMGSRLTQDDRAMGHLMELLKGRNLFFVDSKTINTSVAAKKARETGIPYAVRDVFLDHVDSLEFVRGALKQAEKLALKRGTAIAIGHPRDATIQGLREWIPTLQAKGIEIVPVRDLLIRPAGTVVEPEPSPIVIPSVVEGSGAAGNEDSSAPVANAPSGRDGVVREESEIDKSTVSVTLPDGTEQLIHLPPQ